MITIGSSDVPVILGLAPWKDASEWALQAKLLGLIQRYTSGGNASQRRGRMLEPAILARYAIETGWAVQPIPGPPSPPVVGPEPWMAARPDALVWTEAGAPLADRLAEAKSTRKGWDALPPWYEAQARWQMAVCTAFYVVDVPTFVTTSDEWRIDTVERDLEIERRLVGRVRRWYRRHVLEGVPVDPDGSEATARAIGRAYRGITGETVEATPTDRDLVAQVARLDEAIAELTERRREARNRIRARLGTATRLEADGRTLATFSERAGRTTIDADKLRQLAPDLYAEVARQGDPGRTLTIRTMNGETDP